MVCWWIQVHVQGQTAPLSFTIVCRLTQPTFRISPTKLDFGKALLHEQTGKKVQVTNDSLLPQDVGELTLCLPHITLAQSQACFQSSQGNSSCLCCHVLR